MRNTNFEKPAADEPEISSVAPKIFQKYFDENSDYRDKVWKILCGQFFQKWIKRNETVLDLGCGNGHFINNILCESKFAMDANPASATSLKPEITFICQDCTKHWDVPEASVGIVFTSNFFEHLSGKDAFKATIAQAYKCLRPGGLLIAMGPNIKYLPGSYWDFSDHSLPLTERSLAEVLTACGFQLVSVFPKFLPYNMIGVRRYPSFFLQAYLKMRFAWSIFGKQFLVIAMKSRS